MHVHSPQVYQDLYHVVSYAFVFLYALYGGSIYPVVHLCVLVYTGSGKGHP